MPAASDFFIFDRLFGLGVVLQLIASVWFLFASYSCDVRMARWCRYFPILTIRLLLDYPERCLAPFILQHVSLLLFLPTLFRFLRLFSSVQSNFH